MAVALHPLWLRAPSFALRKQQYGTDPFLDADSSRVPSTA